MNATTPPKALSLSVSSAKQWFGNVPPDLTLYTKLKGGPEYFYTYMRVFYEDPSRPFGVNNLLYENVGMPHPLVHLQGIQKKVCKDVPKIAKNGGEMRDPITGSPVLESKCGDDLVDRGISPLELVENSGELTPVGYDNLIYVLSNFLYFIAAIARASPIASCVVVLDVGTISQDSFTSGTNNFISEAL